MYWRISKSAPPQRIYLYPCQSHSDASKFILQWLTHVVFSKTVVYLAVDWILAISLEILSHSHLRLLKYNVSLAMPVTPPGITLSITARVALEFLGLFKQAASMNVQISKPQDISETTFGDWSMTADVETTHRRHRSMLSLSMARVIS